MASLYEIDMEIMSCIDPETGEVIDYERLDALNMERNRKIEGVACWIKNLLSDAEAIKAEKKVLEDREAKCRKKADDLMNWLTAVLGGEKFSTAKCVVSFRKSETVEVEDVSLIPADLLRVKTTVEPNKTAIKALLKDGRGVIGCRLVENQNVQIK